MKKLKMHSPDFTDKNIAKLAELFPNCVTEKKETIKDAKGGEKVVVTKAIDWDLLKQELSNNIVEGPQERYQLNWPGKREALLTANAPIAKTLRPCREESVNFDTTENLFIEGDNLDALKLLQETYLGKVKMIYIDPPYNTGKDFIYADNFAEYSDEYLLKSEQKDEEGNRLVANTDSNGRFHSDWLSMMYPRLKLARNLLTDDGVIFISIDDGEVHNCQKLLTEVFGSNNFIKSLPTIMNLKGNNDEFGFAGTHEWTLVYAKLKDNLLLKEFPLEEEEFKDWDEDEIGYFKKGANLKATGQNAPKERRPNLWFPIYIGNNNEVSLTKDDNNIELWPITNGEEMSWRWGKEKFLKNPKDLIVIRAGNDISIYKKQRPKLGDIPSKKPKSIFYKPEYSSGNGTASHKELFGRKLFDAPPKPPELIKDFLQITTDSNDIILDFFAGSATTAHAVMQLNAEDGGSRKFIMVQLPEVCDEKTEAFKAGYKTIAEISKERIRRAGKKIKEENTASNLDIGFRVIKVDSSNMADIYYPPDAIEQGKLALQTENIKGDRSTEDLLFHVLLDWGVDLTLPITKESIKGHEVFFVDGNALAACFAKDGEITEDFCKELARRGPLRVVFRDSGFKDDSVKINVEQIFKLLSPHTDVKCI